MTVTQAKITIGAAGKIAAVVLPLFVTMGVTLHRVAAAETEIATLKAEHSEMMDTLWEVRVSLAAICAATEGATCP